MVDGTIVGILFCNIKYIENIKNVLKNVSWYIENDFNLFIWRIQCN